MTTAFLAAVGGGGWLSKAVKNAVAVLPVPHCLDSVEKRNNLLTMLGIKPRLCNP
jgi:hypothetical protein